MRRLAIFILLLALLAFPVSAFSGIRSADSNTTVADDGSCEITLTINLELEVIPAQLNFPLPESAANVTVNGTHVSTVSAGNIRNIDLSGFLSAGSSYSLVIRYRQSDLLSYADSKLTLQLDLLSGFAYPVDNLHFTITLPDAVETRPAFSSTYYEDTIETMMTVTQEGSVISGSVNSRLQDQETLTMSLSVPVEMFPGYGIEGWKPDTLELLIVVLVVFALLYWLVSMRCPPLRRADCITPPEGIAAGSIGCYLTGSGIDLTAMVISWAQMGYLLIQPDDNGRILLHKRMQMGNERSEVENRYFKQLFGKHNVIDGTGYRYAQLYRKARGSISGIRENYHRSAGNGKIIRWLMTLIGILSGISLALNWCKDSGWQIPLAFLLGILFGSCSWLIQIATGSLHDRNTLRRFAGIAALFLWGTLGFLGGETYIVWILLPLEVLFGLATAYGGRRTESGLQNAREILGLCHYLKTLSPKEIQRIIKINPQFYYDMMPYALALGVDKAFTRKLHNIRLPQCHYLTGGMDGHLTAGEWNRLLRDTAAALDALQRKLPFEHFILK